MLVGQVGTVNPEPLVPINNVDVDLARGGSITSVAYPGAFIDPNSGNLHGSYEGPISGQMVAVGFENGNVNNPFVINKYPYQGFGDTSVESAYINPLTNKGFEAEDVITGHFSGSYLCFNTGKLTGKLPGSVDLYAVTDFYLKSDTIVKIEGSTHIELNGNTNWAVLYTELKTAFDTLKTDLNTLIIQKYDLHTHPVVGASTLVPPPAFIAVASTADMSAAKNTKVLM